MITSIHIAGVHDSYAGEIELDDLNYPLTKFNWTPEVTGGDFPKTNSPGSWKTRKMVEDMTIECNGTILADTTSSWWTKYKALKLDIVPPPTNPVDFDHVRLRLVMDGDATNYYAYCVLESNIGALDVAIGSPTVSEFQLMFSCREGYWSSGNLGPLVVI